MDNGLTHWTNKPIYRRTRTFDPRGRWLCDHYLSTIKRIYRTNKAVPTLATAYIYDSLPDSPCCRDRTCSGWRQ